jgi:hypothetical protein
MLIPSSTSADLVTFSPSGTISATSVQAGMQEINTDADSTFLSQVSASGSYLTQVSASGSYLTQVSASGSYLTQVSASTSYAAKSLTINAQVASYTLVIADAGKQVEVSSASGVTLTVPTNAVAAFPIGTTIIIVQTGAGQITVAGSAGVTVNATPGLKLYGQWSTALLLKRATDTWLLSGDLSA